MDWSVAARAFAAIFLAEMGDKTQLAAVTMAASSGRPFSVFAGGSLALATVTAIGVFFGEGLVKAVPELYLRRAAAIAFVAMGVFTWLHD